ncbi:MAG: hypothetical protein ACLGIV_15060 [Actinomycetes bacterium]
MSRLGDLDVVLNDAALPLRGRVVADRRIVLSRDEAARVEYESLTFREFTDFRLHGSPGRPTASCSTTRTAWPR